MTPAPDDILSAARNEVTERYAHPDPRVQQRMEELRLISRGRPWA
ncbi:MAG: hypothetical protein JWO38_2179 [Gemmataceae bacterium]|nr:hypothetical protein [Gemmataceae bacterium]